MDSDQVQVITAIAQAVLALATLIVSIALSLFVYFGARKLTKLQYMRSSFDAWMTLDTFLLANPHLIKMARKLERPDLEESRGEAIDQKRLLGFIILNPYVSYYYAIEHGLIDESFEQSIKTALSKIVRDEEVYRLTQEEIFAEGFARFCKDLKQAQLGNS